MLSITELNQVNIRTKYAVYGWIRNQERLWKSKTTPALVSALCILYVYEFHNELFDIIGNDVKVSSNNKIITKVKNNRDWNNNCYGAIPVISTNNDKLQNYIWQLKIERLKQFSGCIIGISSSLAPNSDIDTTGGYHYAYESTGRILPQENSYLSWKKYGDGFEQDDIVTVHLDLRSKQIAFYVNGDDQGIAYKNIKTGKFQMYRLFVSLYNIHESVRIINFSKE